MEEIKEKGTLYICPTPIGNLGDITLRTLEILRSVDLIAAEDTRHSIKLLNHFEINVPLTSYHEHNKRQKGGTLIEKLLGGMNIALVSDAGMPAVSDPGEDLVALCIQNDIKVVPLPGPSALTAALVASGLPTGRFSFEGFLSVTKRSRAERLDEVRDDARTLIFYEAPHKLLATLKDMLAVFGDRRICLAREISKKYEEFCRTTLSEAVKKYENVSPIGEFVLIVEGKSRAKLEEERMADAPPPEELLKKYAAEGMRGRELVKRVADELNMPKREIYDINLRLNEKTPKTKTENKQE